ncbi:MAG: hypothetical protein ACK5OW_01835, partial [bacterium]
YYKMKTKLKQILLQIFTTKVGWLGFSMFCAILFGTIAEDYEWAQIPFILSWIWPVLYTLIGITYAWIINPIRQYKETKKLKQNKK